MLKAVAMIAVAVAIAVYAPYLAAALLPATASATAIAAVTAAISVGLSLAAGFLLQALAPTPSARTQPINIRQSIGNSYIIIGTRRTVKSLMVFFHPRKVGKSHYRYFIFAVAGHRCHGLVKWMLNDEEVTVNPVTGAVTSGDYAGNAWLWFGRGSYDEDETPAGWRAEVGPKWTENHIGKGVGKIYAKFKLTDDVIEAGMPTISAVIEGSDEIRDPRTDEVGYTDLAVPAFYWWLGLPREEGGFGAAADEIPDDDLLSAWTNICDEDVAIPGGETEKRYTFDAHIETGATPSQIRQVFLNCCAGSFTFSEGRFLMRPGYWVPPSATLHEEDLSGPISIPLLTDAELYANEVNGTFVDPELNYQQQPIPTRRIEAADVRQADYDLAYVSSHYRGQRILEIMLRRAQCEKRVSWPMNIAGLATTAMQTVQLGTARYGLSNYAFVIDDWGLSQDYSVALKLREENAEIYEPIVYLERAAVGTIDKPDPIGVDAPDEGSWALAAGTGSVPSLVFTGAIDDPNADGIIFEWSVDGSGVWTASGIEPKTTTRKEFAVPEADESYLGRVRYTVDGKPGDPLELGPVTAGTIVATEAETAGTADLIGGTYGSATIADLIDRVTALENP